MLTDAQVKQFDHDGFLNGGRILSDAQIQELIDDLHRVIDIGPDGFGPADPKPVLFRNLLASGPYAGPQGSQGPKVWQIVNIWEAAPAFERLLYRPEVVTGISQLTKMPDLNIWHDQIQYKPALAGGATRWHQDAPLWPSILPMTPVSAWIPLDDADEENGCMWMVPGSHKWGDQSKFLASRYDLVDLHEFNQVGQGFNVPDGSEVKEVVAVPWPVKRGEVSFHHSLTWHGSPTNKSPRPRRAIAIHYMTSDSRYVGKRGHPMEQFIHIPDGAPMSDAGEHFPRVCRAGKPTRPERMLSLAAR